jgi:uncharacterized SAM-binding protein YcdF (DUF218 family)
LLVFTGGWRPGEPEDSTEGRVLVRYAEALGIPTGAMVTTGPVTNTADEARAVATLLSARRSGSAPATSAAHVLLVTSAMHMSRARAMFEEAGVRVSPFPVDFKAGGAPALTLNDFMPKASVLQDTDSAWREIYGNVFYSVRRMLRLASQS